MLVIGSDIPGVTAPIIAEAFEALKGHDMVFGPATDGGYWLVGVANGARPLPETLFAGVRWSGRDALADSLATLGDLRVGFCAMLSDVDEVKDLGLARC